MSTLGPAHRRSSRPARAASRHAPGWQPGRRTAGRRPGPPELSRQQPDQTPLPGRSDSSAKALPAERRPKAGAGTDQEAG
jgi:hypothetical protein